MASTVPSDLDITIRLEDGAFWATVTEFPGVFATGDTLEELRASLQEGISLYLAEDGPAPKVTLGPLSVDPAQTGARGAIQVA